MIKNIVTNWKTTTVGVSMLVASIFNIVHSWNTMDTNGWTTSVLGVLGGAGFLYAADSNTNPPPTKPKK